MLDIHDEIFDLTKAQNNLLIFASEAFKKRLTPTDHVHNSEFMTAANKTITLQVRQDIHAEYVAYKLSVSNCMDSAQLRTIKHDLLSWSATS